MPRPVHAILATFPMALVLLSIGGLGRSSVPSGAPGDDEVPWPTADGFGGSHYSPLGDITPATVRHLEVAWEYRTGDVSSQEGLRAGTAFESTPIMVNRTLYLVTPTSRAIALDAETGHELWVFDPRIDLHHPDQKMTTSRGLSYWSDPREGAAAACRERVILATFDARLFALDARTGRPCADFAGGEGLDLGIGVPRIEGRRDLFKQTAPPAIIGDLVVVGSSIFDGHHADAPSGLVRAFDVRSGDLRWSFEPLVGVGGVSENGDSLAAGAANAWATITPDPEHDLVFVPTGSPSPDHYGGLRPGDNGFANSLVALRATTGEVVWSFQTVHHDLWDYDLPSSPALVRLERHGVEIPAVVQTTKMGYVFVLHRETGEPLFPVEERPVPASDIPGEVASATQPVPLLPRPLVPQTLAPEEAWGLTPWDRRACRARIKGLRSEGLYTPPSLRGSLVYPGFIGGMEWGGVGIDPDSRILVTNTNRLAMVATLIPREVAHRSLPAPDDAKYSVAAQAGTPYAARREPLLSPLGIPCTPPPWGMLHALDLNTGAVVWEVPLGTLRDISKVPTPASWGSPNLGGPLVTGGLVIIGASMDRRLRAFDLATGELLWTDRLPASVQSSPMTYRARPGGRQFLVVTAGGHAGLGSALGDYVVAYTLPEDAGREVSP